MRRRSIAWAIAAFELGLSGLAWGIGLLIGQSPWQTLHWRVADGLLGIAATIPLLGLLVVAVRSTWRPFRTIRDYLDEVLRPLLGHGHPAEFALIAGAAGFGEEALFRGVIQPALSHVAGPFLGLLGASILFGLLHAITAMYALLAGVIGLYLGAISAARGNYLAALIAHALYDFVALMYLMKRPVLTDGGTA